MVSAFMLTTNAFSHEVIKNDSGMWEMRTEHMTLITDVKIDDELQSWPELLEQAKAQFQSYFKPDSLKLENLHATVHLIGNRNRWEQLGLIKHLPAFEDGYQLRSKLSSDWESIVIDWNTNAENGKGSFYLPFVQCSIRRSAD